MNALARKVETVFNEPACPTNQGKSDKERKKGCAKPLTPGAAAGGVAGGGAAACAGGGAGVGAGWAGAAGVAAPGAFSGADSAEGEVDGGTSWGAGMKKYWYPSRIIRERMTAVKARLVSIMVSFVRLID